MRCNSWLAALLRRLNRKPILRRSRHPERNGRMAIAEQLEHRIVPATFAEAGATLSLDLDTAAESVGIVSNGATYTLTLVGGTWVGVDSANVTGNTTAVLTVTAAGLATFDTVNLTDSAAATSAAFNDSGANTYTDNFSIVLNNGSGGIAFNGASSFTGSLTLNADNTIVDNAGATLVVTGTTSLTAGAANNITLDNGNDFGGDVTVVSGNNVTLNDVNAIQFGGASTINGNLVVTAAGTITDGAAGTLVVTGTTSLTAGAANNITLDNNNNFGGTVTVVSGKDVTLKDIDDLTLGAATVAGNLSLTADVDDNSASTLQITTAIGVGGSVTLSGGGTGTNDTIDIDADITAATTLTIQNAVAVDLAGDVDLTATNGALSVATNVTAINLSGANGTTNIIDGNGDALVTLANLTDTNNPNLTVNSEGSLTLAGADLGTGTHIFNTDNNNNGTETLTVNDTGTFNVGAGTFQGGTGVNDTIRVNANITGASTLSFLTGVRFGLDATFASLGSGTINFESTVDSDAAITPRALIVNTGGNTDFGNGGEDYLGSLAILSSVTTNATGLTRFFITPSAAATPSVKTVNDQSYGDGVILRADTVFNTTAGNVTFSGVVETASDVVDPQGDLTLDVAGATGTKFLANVGGGTNGAREGLGSGALAESAITLLNGNVTFGTNVTSVKMRGDLRIQDSITVDSDRADRGTVIRFFPNATRTDGSPVVTVAASSVTIQDVSISRGTAGTAFSGDGITFDDAAARNNVTVTNVAIQGNEGAGVRVGKKDAAVQHSSFKLTRSLVGGNAAGDGNDQGGVVVGSAMNSQIGDVTPDATDEGNDMIENGSAAGVSGVLVQNRDAGQNTGITIRGNRYYGNGLNNDGLAINLASSDTDTGVTVNDKLTVTHNLASDLKRPQAGFPATDVVLDDVTGLAVDDIVRIDGEILRVTVVTAATKTLTVVRAQEATSGADHPAGALLEKVGRFSAGAVIYGESVDADSGANKLQNTPEILYTYLVRAVSPGKEWTSLNFVYHVPTSTLNARYGTGLAVEFYLADFSVAGGALEDLRENTDRTDGREGATLIATDRYTSSEALAPKTFTIKPGDLSAAAKTFVTDLLNQEDVRTFATSLRVVATATDADGNTSEFSRAAVVNPKPGMKSDADLPTRRAGTNFNLAANDLPNRYYYDEVALTGFLQTAGPDDPDAAKLEQPNYIANWDTNGDHRPEGAIPTAFNNELGVFLLDDANGTVGVYAPGFVTLTGVPAEGLSPTATTIPVSDVAKLGATVNDILVIDQEQVVVTGVNPVDHTLTVTRAQNGTIAAKHFTADVISQLTVTLTANIDNATTTIPVSNVAQLQAAVGQRLLIGSEQMLVTAVNATSFTVTRAANGTTAAAHTAADVVRNLDNLKLTYAEAALGQDGNPIQVIRENKVKSDPNDVANRRLGTSTLTFDPGDRAGFYLIRNSSRDNFLGNSGDKTVIRPNPNNSPGTVNLGSNNLGKTLADRKANLPKLNQDQAYAFFSIASANPDANTSSVLPPLETGKLNLNGDSTGSSLAEPTFHDQVAKYHIRTQFNPATGELVMYWEDSFAPRNRGFGSSDFDQGVRDGEDAIVTFTDPAVRPVRFASRLVTVTLGETTLTGAITAAQTVFAVADASKLPTITPFNIRVDSEDMTVTSVLVNTLTVTRGAGSIATTHSGGASAYEFGVAITVNASGFVVATVTHPNNSTMDVTAAKLGATDLLANTIQSLVVTGNSLANKIDLSNIKTSQFSILANVTVTGGAGNDTLVGSEIGDLLKGEEGSDSLQGGLGNDTLDGGAADDIVKGEAGNDVLTGGDGKDTLDGGSGTDMLKETVGTDFVLEKDKTKVATEVTDKLSGVESAALTGGVTNDKIDASKFSGSVTLMGLAGTDTLIGGKGNDLLQGGDDSDVLSGGNGNDSLDGGGAVDKLQGDAGNDTLSGGDGNDSLLGGAGTDTFSDEANLDFKLTNTKLSKLTLGTLVEVGFETLSGMEIAVITGGAGNNKIDASLFTGKASLFGKAGNDTLLGGSSDDMLSGSDGNDVLSGGGGKDTLSGGTDNDLLIGGAGADSLSGDTGEDILIGGNTSLTNSSPANFVALSTIMAEWTGVGTYDARVTSLTSAGAGKLNSTTVQNDSNAKDTLVGGSDLDLFFESNSDVLTDFAIPEIKKVI